MDQQEFIRAIEEMKIPASKALEWASVITKKYYGHYIETNRKHHETTRELFDKVADASHRLISMIPQVQKELLTLKNDSTRTSQIFTHVLAGPISTMRDYTKLMLSFPFWLSETEQSEDEQEHIRYLKKINTAAEYLASLDRDVVLKMMWDDLDK
jgi:hypothetical protein